MCIELNRFIKLINENFKDISNEENESLVIAIFRDLDKQELWNDRSALYSYIKGSNSLNQHIDYIENNIKQGLFIEPFKTWTDIPDWYLPDLSHEGLSFTTPTKRNFYIPKFIIQTITQKFPTKTNLNDLSFFAWENHLLPPFIKGLEYPKNEYYNDFTKLDDKQKSLIAFFLCHRFEEKQIIFDKPDKTQKNFFYEYWLPYLKVLFSDINLFDSDNMD